MSSISKEGSPYMRKATGLMLVVMVAAIAATLGGRTAESSAQGLPCDGLPLGFMAPITGFVSFLGTEQLHWAQYSIDRFNKANGTSFTLSQWDTHDLEPALAALGATRLSSDKTVFGVVGPAGSQEVRAAGPIYKKSGMPFLSPSATNADLTSGKYPTFYRVVGSDTQQGTVDAQFMARNLKAKKVFIVDDQTVYSTGLANVAGNVLRKANVDVQRESVGQKVTDFSSVVSKISSDTDVVFLPWQVAANAQLFYRQMVEQGKRAKIFGSDGLDSGDFTAPGRYISSFARDIRGLKGLGRDHQRVRTALRKELEHVRPAELRLGAGAPDGDEEVVCGQEVESCRGAEEPAHNEASAHDPRTSRAVRREGAEQVREVLHLPDHRRQASARRLVPANRRAAHPLQVGRT